MLKKVERTGHEAAVSKSSVREIRSSLAKWSTFNEEQVEMLFPKKGKVVSLKLRAGEDRKAEHIVVDKEQHFIWVDEYCIPPLRTVHSYPAIYPRFVADEGAMRFMLKGANLMCPGLLNEHGSMDNVEEGAVVGIYIHGHEHCVVLSPRLRLSASPGCPRSR